MSWDFVHIWSERHSRFRCGHPVIHQNFRCQPAYSASVSRKETDTFQRRVSHRLACNCCDSILPFPSGLSGGVRRACSPCRYDQLLNQLKEAEETVPAPGSGQSDTGCWTSQHKPYISQPKWNMQMLVTGWVDDWFWGRWTPDTNTDQRVASWREGAVPNCPTRRNSGNQI